MTAFYYNLSFNLKKKTFTLKPKIIQIQQPVTVKKKK